jgi:hypothetical protein
MQQPLRTRVSMTTSDEEVAITQTEHLRVLQWYIQRCKDLENENEKLKEKVRAFYGI